MTARPEDDAVVHDDVGEEPPLASLPLIKRRRPAGGPERLPIEMGWSGWAWTLVVVVLSLTWVAVFAEGRPGGVLQRADVAVLDALVAVRSDALTSAARAIADWRLARARTHRVPRRIGAGRSGNRRTSCAQPHPGSV